jgi:hypothetical protein
MIKKINQSVYLTINKNMTIKIIYFYIMKQNFINKIRSQEEGTVIKNNDILLSLFTLTTNSLIQLQYAINENNKNNIIDEINQNPNKYIYLLIPNETNELINKIVFNQICHRDGPDGQYEIESIRHETGYSYINNNYYLSNSYNNNSKEINDVELYNNLYKNGDNYFYINDCFKNDIIELFNNKYNNQIQI